MFSKPFRLSKTRNVQDVLKHGRAFFSPNLNIKFLQSRPSQQQRFTVVVSSKVHRRAVRRNKIKRIVREEVKRQITSLPNGDWVIFAKPLAAKLTPPELHETSAKALLNAAILFRQTNNRQTYNLENNEKRPSQPSKVGR